ncbi:hypothetical protein [Paenibacillus sp. CR_12]|uniref:hypothetical protein n=1 Tax=Paenibacillus sp. CR_12 TaxID=3055793 RepID=UPI0035C15114
MNAVIDGLMTELEQLLEEKVAEDLRDLLGEYKQLEGAASDRLKQFEDRFAGGFPFVLQQEGRQRVRISRALSR